MWNIGILTKSGLSFKTIIEDLKFAKNYQSYEPIKKQFQNFKQNKSPLEILSNELRLPPLIATKLFMTEKNAHLSETLIKIATMLKNESKERNIVIIKTIPYFILILIGILLYIFIPSLKEVFG